VQNREAHRPSGRAAGGTLLYLGVVFGAQRVLVQEQCGGSAVCKIAPRLSVLIAVSCVLSSGFLREFYGASQRRTLTAGGKFCLSDSGVLFHNIQHTVTRRKGASEGQGAGANDARDGTTHPN
jgi:hypothetical protein